MKDEFSVSKPEDGMIEFSVHHPSNSFEMPVEAARKLAESILSFTEDEVEE